jgi:hypothetical protein
MPIGENISPLGAKFIPVCKLHPCVQTSPLGANFTPGGKLMLLKTGLTLFNPLAENTAQPEKRFGRYKCS